MPQRILQRIYDLSEPLSLAGTRFEFLGSCSAVRRFSPDAAGLIAALEGEFDADELIAANLATRCDSGDLVPAPPINVSPLDFHFMRENKKSPPFDLVTARGCLLDQDPPCFSASRDQFISAILAKTNSLFLTCELREVAILRKLQLAATLVTGLDSLSSSQLRRLCGRPAVEEDLPPFPWHRRAPIHRRSPILRRQDTSISLVGFNLARLEPGMPPVIDRIIRQTFQDCERFGFDIEFLSVWELEDGIRDDLQRAAELRDLILVQSAIQELPFHYPSSYLEKEESWPSDMTGAEESLRHEVERVRKSGFRFDRLNKIRVHCDRLHDQYLIRPLRDAAAATSDPVKRLLLHRAVELAKSMYETEPLQRLAAVIGTRDDNGRADVPTPELRKHRRETARELAEIYRVIGRKGPQT